MMVQRPAALLKNPATAALAADASVTRIATDEMQLSTSELSHPSTTYSLEIADFLSLKDPRSSSPLIRAVLRLPRLQKAMSWSPLISLRD